MKSRKERQIEKAQQVDKLVAEYVVVVNQTQTLMAIMVTQRGADGGYPDGMQEAYNKLHTKAARLCIRVLRHRADLLELGLPTAFDDVPTTGPDALPEGW